ncbi:MAG: N-acetylglucosaminyldiphosphodolichol N-acetylglucosaminyltransferase catalytic subunit alg13 [Alectoria sarmentosa]|nr:MAG: N-acetylglucosaminyldiphosphodolichol N-acetylglucosaminyltransferase catalytic subunit alg13 [Alectoria sarmentosa]
MSVSRGKKKPQKVCFVTVGATASFDSLIRASLSPPFLEALKTYHYTELRLQHGKDEQKIMEDFMGGYDTSSEEGQDLLVGGFDFNKQGLGSEMRAAKGESEGIEGVVISHAGSGSILDALRIAVPIIVVPNPDLLDNHQNELAEELATQGYVVHGHLNDLPAAVRQSERLRETQITWPPAETGEDPSGKGLVGVMDDEMGFVD